MRLESYSRIDRLFLGAVTLVVCTSIMMEAPAAQSQSGNDKRIPYDEFCKKGPEERAAYVKSATAEEKVVIARWKAERFLKVREGKLSTQQVSALKEMISAIAPTWFGVGSAAELAKGTERRHQIEVKLTDLFGREDQSLLRPNGPCVS